MRRLVGLLALLLLAAAGARAEQVTVIQLREQAEAMGRWRKTYEAHGRTIEVDVPILVPEADAFPVVTVERAVPLTDEQMAQLLAEGKRIDADLVFDIGDERAPGELWVLSEQGRTNDPQSRAGLTVSRGGAVPGGKEREWCFAWELDADTAYAGEATLADAAACLKGTLEAWYPGMEIDAAFSWVLIRDAYWMTAEQHIEGIPVFGSIAEYGLHHVQTQEEAPQAERLADVLRRSRSSLAFNYAGDENFCLTASVVSRRETVTDDVPFAPLDDVLAGIEAEIESGRVRAVYALRLGYVLYVDREDDTCVWAIPSWLLSCTYAHTAEEKLLREQKGLEALYEEGEWAFWSDWEYEEIAINAQTGEWMKYTIPDEETYLCPEIAGW